VNTIVDSYFTFSLMGGWVLVKVHVVQTYRAGQRVLGWRKEVVQFQVIIR